MEYFKKISVKTVPQTIIDSPIRIQEVAILQDPFDKNILGRVKFVNQSRSNVIAVFLDLEAKDISGETISLRNPVFIYQDMVVLPGELYGNEISIDLPDTVRIFNVHINKIVFEDGNVWKASDAKTCSPLPLEQMELPKENAERIKSELTEIIPNVEYINYYYQENDTAWLCSCGRVNSTDNETCPFCDCLRSSQEQILTKNKFKSFCDTINDIVKKEQQKQQEEENRRREEERRQQEEEDKKEKAHQEEEQRKFRRQSIIVAVIAAAVIAVALIIWAVYTYSIKPQREYNNAMSLLENGDYQDAIDAFEALGDYQDAEEQLENASQYSRAETLVEAGQFKSAMKIFKDLGDYRDSKEKAEETTQIYLNGNEENIETGKFRSSSPTVIGKIVGMGDDRITVENAYETGFILSLAEADNYTNVLSIGDKVIVNLDDELSNIYGVYEVKEIFETNSELWISIPGDTKLEKATACAELYADSVAIHAPGVKSIDVEPLDIPKSNDFKFTCYVRTDNGYSKETIFVNLNSSVYIVSSSFFDTEIEIQDYESNIDYSSSSNSSSKSSSSSSSTSHTCQVSGCNNIATHSITGLNGTQEYYCSEHYSQLGGMMDMIMGD